MSLTRRKFLAGSAIAAAGSLALVGLDKSRWRLWEKESVFIGKADTYDGQIIEIILSGFKSLGIERKHLRDKTILLKPNLVEPHAELPHINTHPMMVKCAIEAFRRMDAKEVIVAEAPGHRRDTLLVLEESGFGEMLRESKTRFHDLNFGNIQKFPNSSGWTNLPHLHINSLIAQADWVVSMPKLKLHHWDGVTLSMKNLFGVMPGDYYGWPKNVLHWHGISESILDIVTAVKPSFAIVDGIWGMEGDGPIMGEPVFSGLILMGKNPASVDASGARLMGIDPHKLKTLSRAEYNIGPIHEEWIIQTGETIQSLRRNYKLLDFIPAQQNIRWEA